MLAAGGNAVDAAVAISLTMGVVEPFASGLGGGGFMLVSSGGGTEILDFRGRVPSIDVPEHFYPKGATLPWVPKIGPSSATIPGLGRALATAMKRYGAKLPLATIAAPAIRAAEEGFEVSETYAYVSGLFEGTVRCFPDAARTYFKEGRRYRPGERLVQKELGRALRRVSEKGFEEVYTGEIGRAMVAAVNGTGPVWGERDLEQYEVKIRAPLTATIGGALIETTPPPSRGGPGIVLALERLHEARGGHNTKKSILALGELIRELFQKLDAVVGDPDVIPVDLSKLGIAPKPGSPSTTHFVAVDREGLLVSMSQTIGHFFGAGVIVPGWGICLNDDISDMERRPGLPNSVRPNERPVANMAPTLVRRNGAPWFTLGTPGSLRIFPCMTQVIANVLFHGMDLEKALAVGRMHWEDETLWLEGDIDAAIRAAVKAEWKGRVVERRAQDLFFGGVHAVGRDGNEWVGVADPRRDGVALGL
jgi:gamma-glutamyltranspeptidase/glutathione hydrolase